MDPEFKKVIRLLRKNSTIFERLFWNVVRGRKLNGYKFLRQHPINCYTIYGEKIFIADFYCAKRKLVVELDGPVHDFQRDYDELRTHIIEQKGMNVIRFTNDEIQNDMDRVISRLIKYLDK